MQKGNCSHTLYFCELNAMEVIDKMRKVLRFLMISNQLGNARLFGLPWKDRIVPYSMIKRLIIMAIVGTKDDDDDNDEALVP